MSPCPSTRELRDLLEERLGAAEQRLLSAHVDACGHCQGALEELTADPAGPASSIRQMAMGSSPSVAFLDRLKETPPSPQAATRSKGASTVEVRQRPAVVLPEIPGYEILGELGRGGMGVVYKARQVGLNRLVALKMILAGSSAAPKDLARFRQEAEAVARLHHTNIVQIYDVGESEGRPYLALEYVAEGGLVEVLRGNPQPVYPAARLIEQLALAIHFAHQHGLVHRDLKPANILLAPTRASDATPLALARGADATPFASSRDPDSGPAAESEVDYGIPKITDFGLAKRLDKPAGGTHTGEVVGTPSYMAPEQAASKGAPVGPAADVYALGAMFYEMLTGRPPFKAATAFDTVLQVLHEEPLRPSQLRPQLARDLETICLKCLAKEPARRYASAEALADDLRRFRRGVPILARPVGAAERSWKWARRHPTTAALSLGIVLVTLLSFGSVMYLWQQARTARDVALDAQAAEEHQRQDAERARDEADRAKEQARGALYSSRIAQSQIQWQVNDLQSARLNLERCLPTAGQRDRRGWEWYYLRGLYHADLFTLSHHHGGVGGNVEFSMDGRQIASVVGGFAAGEEARPGEVRLWNAATGRPERTFRGPANLNRLSFAPEGKRLALATTDGTVLLWDAATGQDLIPPMRHGDTVAEVAFSPDGKFLASAGWDGSVQIWDTASGRLRQKLTGHSQRVQSVAFAPGGRFLATGCWDGTVKVWDPDTWAELHTLDAHKSAVYCVTFSPDGMTLASAGSNGNLKIWHMGSRHPRVIQSLTGHAGAVLGIDFSPDGRYLAYGGSDTTVRVWDVEAGTERVVFRGHTAEVEGVHFSPDGQRLASFSPGQGVVKVWDLTRHPEYATFARTGRDVEGLAYDADDKRLVSVTIGGKLQTWDAATGVLLDERTLPLEGKVVSPAVLACFAPRARQLAARAAEDPRLVKTWDVTTGAVLVTFRGHQVPVSLVRFSDDGRRLATCGCDTASPERPNELKVWDAATGEPLMTREGRGQVFSAAFSPDGRLLVLGGQAGGIAVLDWETQQTISRTPGHAGNVTAVAFSASGRRLASAGVEDRTIKIWDVDEEKQSGSASPRLVHTLAAPDLVCDLAFSPDGRRLVCANRDLVKMWDARTGREVLTLRGAPQRHYDQPFNPRVAFSADGARLAASNWDESISAWDGEVQDNEETLAARKAARRRAADGRALFWHLQEAEQCLEQKNLPAAVFHFQRLGNEPLPGPLKARKVRLAQAMTGRVIELLGVR
jgi:WD40 repeat protein/serine/threonine protein kinase